MAADLTFTIKTPAELQGAEQAARQLEINIGKAKALGKEFGTLEAKLKDVRQSIDQYKLASEQAARAEDTVYSKSEKHVFVAQSLAKGQADLRRTSDELEKSVAAEAAAQGEAANQTHKSTEAKKILGAIAKALPPEIHAIGHALKEAFSHPLVALIILLAGSVKFLFEQLRKLNEEARTAVFGKTISTAMREAADAVALAVDPWKDYNAQLAAAAKATREVGEATNSEIEGIKHAAEQADEYAEAEKRLAAAKLEAMHAAGQLSDDEFARRSAGLESTYDSTKAARAAETQRKIIAAKEGGLARATAESSGLLSGVYDAAKESARIEAAIKAATGQVAALEELKKTRTLTPQESGNLTQSRNLITSAGFDLADAKRKETEAKRALDANTAAIASLTKEIPALKQGAALDEEHRARMVRTNREARDFPFGGMSDAAGILDQARAAGRKKLSGGKLSADESSLLTFAGSQVQGAPVSTDTAARMMAVADKSKVTQEAFLNRILAAMERLHEIAPALEARMRALEQRLADSNSSNRDRQNR